MEFDFAHMAEADRYKLMTAAITPRPIAWVTTQSVDGVRNAAPYSFFNMMGADPPLLVIGMMRRWTEGPLKDTAANILQTGEFVVNLVREGDGPQMNFTCIDAPPAFDEISAADIALVPSSVVRPGRIATAPVSMECRLYREVDAGNTTIVLGEVLRFHIDDVFVDRARLHIDTLAMNLIARMHGRGWYARSRDLLRLERPVYAEWEAAGRPPIPGAGPAITT